MQMNPSSLPETAALRRRYADLFDFAPVGYFVLASDGTILEVNPAGAVLLGQDRFDLVNQRFERFVSAATRPHFNAFLGQILSSASRETCEVILATHRLLRRHLHLEGAAVASDAGQRCHVAVTGYTEHPRAEEKTLTTSQLLSSVVDSLPIHLAILNEHGIILAVNARWKQFADENALEAV